LKTVRLFGCGRGSDHDGKGRETAALRRQHQDVTTRILAAMSRRDREALMRFYLDGQAEEQIEADLGLTEIEFRLIKSRARDQFHNVWLQRIAADKPAVEAGSRTNASHQPHRQSLCRRHGSQQELKVDLRHALSTFPDLNGSGS
jgi:hypothetical protein